MSSAQVAWVSLPTESVAHWLFTRRVPVPAPLSSAAIGRCDLPMAELVGLRVPVEPPRMSGEQRLLEDLAAILSAPGRAVSAVRTCGAVETHAVAVIGADAAMLVVDTPHIVRLARVDPQHVAAALAGALPRIATVPMAPVTLPVGLASRLSAALAAGAAPPSLRAEVAAAGVPDWLIAELLDGAPPAATGTLMALRYTGSDAAIGNRSAVWVEIGHGGMLARQDRSGPVTWEPATLPALARAIGNCLASTN